MAKIGEGRSERLDVISALSRVQVTLRPKYICRSCAGASHAQVPAPERMVPRGPPTERFVVRIMASKFGDYFLFYRQANIYRRLSIEIDRTLLANWSGRAALLLQPAIDEMIDLLRRSDHLQMDETTIPLLAPGTRKISRGYLWAILRDQLGWGGVDPPSWWPSIPDTQRRDSTRHPQEVCRCHVDGRWPPRLRCRLRSDEDGAGLDDSLCWTHWWQRFVKFAQDTGLPICDAMIARIA